MLTIRMNGLSPRPKVIQRLCQLRQNYLEDGIRSVAYMFRTEWGIRSVPILLC